RAAVVEQLDVHAAERARIVDPDRRAERAAAVARERDERAAFFLFGVEPGDRHVASARAQCRSVDRTRVDLPAVVVYGGGRGPAAVDETAHGDVARLVLTAV